MKNTIFIIYPYYLPAQKAGGIVSSLVNLVHNLDNYHFYIYTSCYDLDGTQHTTDTNQWTDYDTRIKVYYSDNADKRSIKELCQATHPTHIYINGIYGYKFFLKPLLTLKNSSFIIAPRGMLHAGALQVKQTKKRIYLLLLKRMLSLKTIRWHATDAQEVVDIKRQFKACTPILAQDTPPLNPAYATLKHYKTKGQLNLIFLSLITEKKNLLFLLKLIDQNQQLTLHLDIIGPIKDKSYWETCLTLVEKNKTRVRYVGSVATDKVITSLHPYDFFILPTLGENFGHVIFEALTAGKPVITSHFTPWSDLESQQAGFNLELTPQAWHNTITKLIEIDNTTYQHMALGAQSYLKNYLRSYTPQKDYQPLFD